MSFHLEPLQEAHFERLHHLFDAVCRERRFLAFTQAAPMDQTFAYYRSVLAGGHTHFVAVRGTALLGWCDVLPLSGQMRAHAGTLGMAVAAAERGKGIGRQLILAAISAAEAKGLRRIELTVHAENQAAQALYSRVGFEYEGTQRRGWCLDGAFFDVHHMARVSDA
jgi:RimJ/RimL family protein N-acetyltransferase